MGWNRRFPTWALALAAVVFMWESTTAQAQLFPDSYIKRRRPCCASEDPRYRIVREQYFGYYPTCWRQFPPGWGCYPKVGAPDWEAAQRELPLDPTSLLGEDQDEAGREPGGLEPPAGRDRMPELPGDENLFPGEGAPNPTPPPGQDPDPFRRPASGTPSPLGDPGGPAIEAPRADSVAPPPAISNSGTPLGAGLPTAGTLPSAEGLPSALSDAAAAAPALTDPNPAAAPALAPAGEANPPLAAPGLALPTEVMPGPTPPEGPIALPGDLGLEGDRPQAPPLAPPSAVVPGSLPPNMIPGPVTSGGGFGPIPDPTLDQLPPTPNGEARPDRRRGPIANFLGRMRKR